MPEFSVLLPVYHGDVPSHFTRALRSVGADQTLPPDQIVIVADGPVPSGIAVLLDALEQGGHEELTGGAEVTVVRRARNSGLGPALNDGLRACVHDVVARADADDISHPHRFEVQIPHIESGRDIVGSAIVEFEEDEHRTGMVRRMPRTDEEIRRSISFRDPFNHPTVVYRVSGVCRAGWYEDLPLMEDYWLFARMVADGQEGYNDPEPLVSYRVGAGAYRRRGGMRLLRSEISLQRRMYLLGVTDKSQYLRNLIVRGAYRLVPTALRRLLYTQVGGRKWFRSAGDAT
ncbi:MAG: glycosyltransferase [Propionibacterium sp.]|nr:glycosyltransferase [Propionibacterium sp.]